MIKYLYPFFISIIFFDGCNDVNEDFKDKITLNSPTYLKNGILIKWSKINDLSFLRYNLYYSEDEYLINKTLLHSSDNREILSYIDTNIDLQLNEKKFYQVEAVAKDCTYISNLISAHNWHINDDIYNANMTNYTIHEISNEEYFYYRDVPFTLQQIEELYSSDSIGIPYYLLDGVKYDHPVRRAQIILHLLNSHNFDPLNSEFIDRAKLLLDHLISTSHIEEDALFFPYPFTFNLHSDENEAMLDPWYSCMAQGQALSAFSKYFEITRDTTYLINAEKIFNSFLKIMQSGNPWVTGIDGKNYLWLEEYPDENQPNKTLNGKIFAIYGLYDFYQITGNLESLNLLKMAITTIQNYIFNYRVIGQQSVYCLTHMVQHPRYHRIHTKQLGKLYDITHEQFFLDAQQIFESDYNENSN